MPVPEKIRRHHAVEAPRSGRATPAWLVATVEDRQHGGNDGYQDDPKRLYRWDSTVPNHERVRVGDHFVVRAPSGLVGVGVVMHLEVHEDMPKTRYRCPECNRTTFKPRSKARPRYRCYTASCLHEFDDPAEEQIEVTEYVGHYAAPFLEAARAVNSSDLFDCALRLNKNHSIQPVDLEAVLRLAQISAPSSAPMPVAAGRFERVSSRRRQARQPFTLDYDPKALERGTEAHQVTQDRLAEVLEGIGVEPLERGGLPDFDLAFRHRGEVWVVEVKSLTTENAENQLRLGLGQVLRYRAQIGAALGVAVRAALAIERAPPDPTWRDACEQAGVVLAVAPGFEWLSHVLATDGLVGRRR